MFELNKVNAERYADNCCCKTESTIMETSATSETITTLVPTVTKVIDVIIPNGVSIINQQILDELLFQLRDIVHIQYSMLE